MDVSLVLSVSFVGQAVSAILGIMIDAEKFKFVYVTAIPIIFLNVSVCMLEAYYLRTHSQRYDNLHHKTSVLENSISELAKRNSVSNYKGFYCHMLQSLYNLTSSEYVFIVLKENTSDPSMITTNAVLQEGRTVKHFSYNLAATPCERVLNNETCVYSHSVAELFAEDSMLVDMKIEAHLGMPLLG